MSRRMSAKSLRQSASEGTDAWGTADCDEAVPATAATAANAAAVILIPMCMYLPVGCPELDAPGAQFLVQRARKPIPLSYSVILSRRFRRGDR